ncbi:uncharacterized protein LOC128717144 [Anopheles marshallii]|uniref:uncharacterized protein LOC128717144 n=1 Tax=Anopheles marshallii TaxID=1521116 RepID=UPI00237B4B24|nr:uncharacterized protein LOC128717144 [Anopheles marshallii]
METVQLFKAMGQRVATLPPAQQIEIIDTVRQMIDASQKLNRSAALAHAEFQRPTHYNLAKSVSQSAASLNSTDAMATAASLVSSPSYIL